jgi:predicted Zn-dependent peptidase
MRNHSFVAAATAAAGAFALAAPATTSAALPRAQAAASSAASAKVSQVQFESYTLPNGLRVLLSPDKSAPVVSISVTYDTGSRNERPGRSGFAHLFEHMMFQGSENVGKGEHFFLIQNNGGTFNGTTSQDRTNYFATLPANQLDLALFLEADRMRSLDISQANLDNQRAVVQEEKRQSYENRAYGGVQEAILDLAYEGFPYKHTTIGSMADLDAASLDDVRQFFKTYYAPNNAALALVGDFDVNDAKRKIERYFGGIPRQPAPAPVVFNEPAPSGERRKTLSDPLARLPQVNMAYRTVSGNEPDYFALEILGVILGRGRTSRLYQALVEKNLAISAFAGAQESRGPGLFRVGMTLPPGSDPARAEQVVDEEIARIQSGGVTEGEMNKARAQERAGAVRQLESTLGRANALSQYAVFYNDPGRINTELARLQAVTAADVQRVASKYLTKANRVVVIVQPATAGARVSAATAAEGSK